MKGSTVFKGFLLLIAVIFISHQCISAFYKPIKTESAVYYTATDGFKITGLIIRNETLVKSQSKGVLHFVTGDGNRVAKDGIIANIYDSNSASVTVSQMDAVKAKIADLNDLLSYNDVEAADLDLINSRVKTQLNNFIIASSDGNYDQAKNSSDGLLSALNRRQIATGVANDFSSQLTTLNSQLQQLSSALPASKGQITSSISGYFVSSADGYEDVLNCDNPEALTPEYLKKIQPSVYDNTVVGKIVSDYEWFVAADVSINESLTYKEGESLKLYTSVKSFPIIDVTVKKINISDSSSRAVILFSCHEMNSELATMRSGPMKVVKKEYSGLKVPKNALRVVDSVRGVYTLSGMQAKFVPVNILYSNDSYMICEKQNTDKTVLRVYDQVIVKGKKLYDGKVVG